MHTIRNIAAPVCGFLVAAVLATLPFGASAYEFRIDEFTVSKNDGTTGFSGNIINDTFSDGLVPPNPTFFGPGSPDYALTGLMGPEIGGRLHLNSATGSVTFSPLGTGFISQIALLRTNIDNSNFANGLKTDDTFSVTGLFDLIVPGANGDGYGIRLTDRNTGTGAPFNAGNDHIQLFVIRDFVGTLRIVLNTQSFIDGTSANLASASLNTAHDQIALRLERLNASSNDLTASYAYGDDGVLGSYVAFANHATIFHGEEYTRAGFMTFGLIPAPIPEPETYAMLLAGFGLLGVALRRRRKSADR